MGFVQGAAHGLAVSLMGLGKHHRECDELPLALRYYTMAAIQGHPEAIRIAAKLNFSTDSRVMNWRRGACWAVAEHTTSNTFTLISKRLKVHETDHAEERARELLVYGRHFRSNAAGARWIRKTSKRHVQVQNMDVAVELFDSTHRAAQLAAVSVLALRRVAHNCIRGVPRDVVVMLARTGKSYSPVRSYLF